MCRSASPGQCVRVRLRTHWLDSARKSDRNVVALIVPRRTRINEKVRYIFDIPFATARLTLWNPCVVGFQAAEV